jgi:hypothetical protein
MERETGIEPATSSLGSWRSTAELLPPGFNHLTAISSGTDYRSWISICQRSSEETYLTIPLQSCQNRNC